MKEIEFNNGNIDFIWNGYLKMVECVKKVVFINLYMNNY